ncbi:MAG: hypothetical protein K2H46_01200 [Muribaculaceae bacterium]|nr:hypothetical protein [Muribaculaceae bacterium]
MKVIPSVGSISIVGASDWDLVEVFDPAGKKLESTYSKEISLSSGIYIVRVGGTTFKVVL